MSYSDIIAALKAFNQTEATVKSADNFAAANQNYFNMDTYAGGTKQMPKVDLGESSGNITKYGEELLNLTQGQQPLPELPEFKPPEETTVQKYVAPGLVLAGGILKGLLSPKGTKGQATKQTLMLMNMLEQQKAGRTDAAFKKYEIDYAKASDMAKAAQADKLIKVSGLETMIKAMTDQERIDLERAIAEAQLGKDLTRFSLMRGGKTVSWKNLEQYIVENMASFKEKALPEGEMLAFPDLLKMYKTKITKAGKGALTEEQYLSLVLPKDMDPMAAALLSMVTTQNISDPKQRAEAQQTLMSNVGKGNSPDAVLKALNDYHNIMESIDTEKDQAEQIYDTLDKYIDTLKPGELGSLKNKDPEMFQAVQKRMEERGQDFGAMKNWLLDKYNIKPEVKDWNIGAFGGTYNPADLIGK